MLSFTSHLQISFIEINDPYYDILTPPYRSKIKSFQFLLKFQLKATNDMPVCSTSLELHLLMIYNVFDTFLYHIFSNYKFKSPSQQNK